MLDPRPAQPPGPATASRDRTTSVSDPFSHRRLSLSETEKCAKVAQLASESVRTHPGVGLYPHGTLPPLHL